MKKLISHETPIQYLPFSTEWNDYDYCLVHLCEQFPAYRQYYIDAVKNGREVILDNSIFELGKAFNGDKFAEYVELIKPTWYIVPDVLEDSDATIGSFHDFVDTYPNLPGRRMGVVQGKTQRDLVDCYEFMSEYADYIAISFDYSFYKHISNLSSRLEQFADGRIKFIKSLVREGYWNHIKPHHLLGCSLPIEFAYYKNMPNIRTIDTSNPIVAAIEGTKYLPSYGLLEKSSVKLADYINVRYDHKVLQHIRINAIDFAHICNQ